MEQRKFAFGLVMASCVLMIMCCSVFATEELVLQGDPLPPVLSAAGLDQNPTGFYQPLSMRNVRPGRMGVAPASLKFGPSDPSFDWVSEGIMTAIRDQNPCNYCWIFATLGEFESKEAHHESTSPATIDYSEQDIANYYSDVNAMGGNTFMGFSFLAQHGTVAEADEPYLADTATHSWVPGNTKVKKVKTMYFLGDLTNATTDVTTIKNALTYGPVTISMSVDACRAWSDSLGHGTGDGWWGQEVVPYTVTDTATDHLVVIVGWDDNKWQYGNVAQGAWKCRNSWGTGFGVSGYFWLGYGAALAGSNAGYMPLDGYEDFDGDVTMLADDHGWYGSFGYVGVSSAYIVAKYTVPSLASGVNTLYAVDFAALNPDTHYEFRIYSDFDGTDPVGSPLVTQSGNLNHAGYYSIDLNVPMIITAGETRVIWLKLTTPSNTNYQYGVTKSDWSSGVSGQYYYSAYGTSGSWQDVMTDGTSYSNEMIVRGRIHPDSSATPTPVVPTHGGAGAMLLILLMTVGFIAYLGKQATTRTRING